MARLTRGKWAIEYIVQNKVFWIFVVGCGIIRAKFTLILVLLVCMVKRFLASVITENLKDIPLPVPKRLPNSSKDANKLSGLEFNELFPEYPELSTELEQLFDNIVRDFIQSWFHVISTNPRSRFPLEVKRNLRDITVQLCKLVEDVDLSDFLVLKTLPLVTRHFMTFCTARETVISDKLIEKSHEEEFPFAIAVEFNRNHNVHKAISLGSDDPFDSIEAHLREKADLILTKLLDEKELDSLYVRIILREILTCCVFSPLVRKLTDPDFWNMETVGVATSLLQERSQVKEFRALLSREVESPHDDVNSSGEQISGSMGEVRIDVTSSGKDFEKVLRQINSLNTTQELKSVKFSMMIQLIKLLEVEDFTKSQTDLKKRLLLSLNLIESRLNYKVGYLSPKRQIPLDNNKYNTQLHEFDKFMKSITLEDILSDDFCRKFFHDYLKLNGQRGEMYLDFWSSVQSIKNPLEDPANEELAMDLSEGAIVDLKNVYHQFFSGTSLKSMSILGADYVNEIVEYMRLSSRLEKEELIIYYLRARKSLLLLQIEAYKILKETYFPKFRISNMFPQLISAPEFQETESFKRFINGTNNMILPKEESDPQLHSVQIVEDGDITKALDEILQSNANDRKTPRTKTKKSFSSLFGNDGSKEIFKDDLFDDESIDLSDESESNESLDEPNELISSIHENLKSDFAPKESMSDSQYLEFSDLKDKIAEITLSIDLLKKQTLLLNHLILKAELTNNSSQLKLLKKSERSVSKELENKELLRQQFIVQENANSLYGKCKISIRSYLTDISAGNGKEVAYYVIKVSHINNNQVNCWDIPRRFNEFFKLNAYLKKNYGPLVKHLQNKDNFPEKVKMSLIYHVSKSLLYEERMVKLEKYLRRLLIIPEVCQDRVFRRFLTDTSTSFDVEGETNDNDAEKRYSLLSRIESIPSRMESMAPKANDGTDSGSVHYTDAEDHPDADVGKELEFLVDQRNFFNGNANTKKTSFVKPICDFSIALFSLNNSNSGWLRGRAILVVLQQLLGGTIEKYIKVTVARMTAEEKILDAVSSLKSLFWNDEGFTYNSQKSERLPRTTGEIVRTQMEARKKVGKTVCGDLRKSCWYQNSKNAGFKLHAMAQNHYLNASLVLEILDLIFEEVFS